MLRLLARLAAVALVCAPTLAAAVVIGPYRAISGADTPAPLLIEQWFRFEPGRVHIWLCRSRRENGPWDCMMADAEVEEADGRLVWTVGGTRHHFDAEARIELNRFGERLWLHVDREWGDAATFGRSLYRYR